MIASYINTWNRSRLATTTIRGFFSAVILQHDLTIVDDASEPDQLKPIQVEVGEHGSVKVLDRHVGPGLSRRHAIQLFAESTADIGMFFDSDVIFSVGFDKLAVNLYQEKKQQHWPCFGSAYRSCLDGHMSKDVDMGNYILGSVCGGLSMVMDRETARLILKLLPEEQWDTMWDWNLCAQIPRCVKPHHSLVDHMLIRNGDSIHKGVRDHAYKFVGTPSCL